MGRACDEATAAAEAGGTAPVVLAAAWRTLVRAEGVEVDYVELVAADTLAAVTELPDGGTAVLLVAARVGGTRLIDNVELRLASG